MTLARRLRGVLGAAIIWATAFAVVGALFVAVEGARGLLPPPWAESPAAVAARVALRAARFGALAGLVFACTVILAERRRTFDALTSRRFALWGFVAGVFVPLALSAGTRLAAAAPFDAGMFLWSAAYGVVGAGIGAASHRLARRDVPSRERAEIEAPVI